MKACGPEFMAKCQEHMAPAFTHSAKRKSKPVIDEEVEASFSEAFAGLDETR